jgi:GNAT superfamily N-acetyltransferase
VTDALPHAVLHPSVREATPADVRRIRELIVELAAYERSADQVRATDEQLHAALFGERPAVFALVAEADGDVVGFALWFLNFSTWEGVHGIYLEDLYVRPDNRGSGLGKALLRSLASIAVARGYARFEWWVLDWNTPSIDFYRSMGALGMDEWTVFRLTGDALRAAAY